MPIISAGLMVRDFAIFIREKLCIPETTAVVLCDASTHKPLRGSDWVHAKSAVLIRLQNDLSMAVAPANKFSLPDQGPSVTGRALPVMIDVIAFDAATGVGIGGFAKCPDKLGCITPRDVVICRVSGASCIEHCEINIAHQATEHFYNEERWLFCCASPYLCRNFASDTRWLPLRHPSLAALRRHIVSVCMK